MSYLWTSEAVSAGHPDKVADQLADTVLDAYLKLNPITRVACEVTCMKDQILITGETSSSVILDVEDKIREKLTEIGYDRPENSYDAHTIEIVNKMNGQSSEIAQAVAKDSGDLGAGDQGLMFGFACDETDVCMPLAHHLSFEIIDLLEKDIRFGRVSGKWDSPFLPDIKSQVTVRYVDSGKPVSIDTIVISAQYREQFALGDLRACLDSKAIEPLRRKYSSLFDDNTKLVLQPSGAWHVGGPASDTGLSGRKIVVDNYGADCPIGGGSFSGKDPTKVDRSAAYAARHIAKNIVVAELAQKVRIQLSYAIGVVEPVSLRVESFGTSEQPDALLTEMVRDVVDLTPKGIIDRLELRRPIYAETASGGHFGREDFSWERTELVDTFKDYWNR
jgi:S-adenosylmethionine synthetase